MAELQRENTYDDQPIKMGYRYGGTQGITVPATNADYYNRLGGAFVKIVDGVARMCGSRPTASLDGWLCMNKETTRNTAQKGNGQAYFVITDTSAVFEIPHHGAYASVGASLIGAGCMVTTGHTTTTGKQKAWCTPKNATPLLIIRDVDKTNQTLFVSINPARLDTGQ